MIHTYDLHGIITSEHDVQQICDNLAKIPGIKTVALSPDHKKVIITMERPVPLHVCNTILRSIGNFSLMHEKSIEPVIDIEKEIEKIIEKKAVEEIVLPRKEVKKREIKKKEEPKKEVHEEIKITEAITNSSQIEEKKPQQKPSASTWLDFIPLIIITLLILVVTCARRWYEHSWHTAEIMQDFMGFFFMVFGAFKLLNLKGFVEAYRSYDIIAKRSNLYAKIYPCIEIALGIFYLLRLFPVITNSITLLLMFVSSIGVAQALLKKEKIVCACLGTVFKIPMTYVTLAEDVLMALMALAMLTMH